MVRLRDHMESWLNGWRTGLCPAWQKVVGEEGPDCGVIGPEVMIEPSQLIFPRRHLHAVDPPQAPPETHIYRALNSLPPERVAVIFMGQDPYPRPCRATGRSFEAGDLNDWHRVGEITALRRICQQLAAHLTADPRYQQIDKWQLLKQHIERGTVQIPSIRETFDNWQGAGVLLLNRSLTATTRPMGMRGDHPHLCDHLALWRPMVRRICCYLAQRGNVVFVLLGKRTQDFFDEILPSMPANTCTVRRRHPSFTDRRTGNCPFLEGDNLFREINDGLQRVGQQEVFGSRPRADNRRFGRWGGNGNGPMNTVLDEVTSDAIDAKHVERRVKDWEERLDDLYALIDKWLPDGWEARRGVPIVMHEPLMRKFGMGAKRMPTLELRDKAGHAARLEPHALWIIGENGRVDLKLDGRYHYIIDTAENFARPNWEVSRAERRCDSEAVTREWLRRVLQ